MISDTEFRNFFCLLVAAGNDTTRYSIAAALHALANQPGLMAQLKAVHSEAAWEGVSDEFIRWAAARLGDKLVVSLDARDGMLATHGWTQVSDRAAVDVAADLARTGVRHLLYTDISRDGTLGGPNLGALRKVAQAAPPLSILASGGISSLDDLTALAQLRVPNIRGVIVGRALYEGRFSVAEAITTLENASR